MNSIMTMANTVKTLLMVTVCFACFSLQNIANAAASLSFSPQRLILQDKDRTATLQLTNRGDQAATFRVSMLDFMYAANGTVKPLATLPRGFPTARPFVRFSPSQVRLAPGESQNVRVLLKNAKSIPNGELRVHVSLAQLPNVKTSVKEVGNNALRTSMGLGQAVAIPLMIRRGITSVKGALGSVHRTRSGLNIMLARAGNKSLYANVEVYAGRSIGRNKIGFAKGVAVPVPNRNRQIKVSVNKPSNQPYFVVLRDHDTGEVIAQRKVP